MKRILFAVLMVELVAVGAVSVLYASEPETDESADVAVDATVADAAVAADVEFSHELAAVLPAGHGAAEEHHVAQPRPIGSFSAQASHRKSVGPLKLMPKVVINFEEVGVSEADDSLQRKYNEVMRRRAQRMTAEELKSSIEQFEAEMKEQDAAADAEVKKAITVLETVIEMSPGTPAAERSRLAISVLKNELPGPGMIQPGTIQMDSY